MLLGVLGSDKSVLCHRDGFGSLLYELVSAEKGLCSAVQANELLVDVWAGIIVCTCTIQIQLFSCIH